MVPTVNDLYYHGFLCRTPNIRQNKTWNTAPTCEPYVKFCNKITNLMWSFATKSQSFIFYVLFDVDISMAYLISSVLYFIVLFWLTTYFYKSFITYMLGVGHTIVTQSWVISSYTINTPMSETSQTYIFWYCFICSENLQITCFKHIL